MIPEWTAAVQILIVAVLLFPACISDWRYREVPDKWWALIGAAGIFFSAYVAFDRGFVWQYAMMLAGMAMILFDVFSDRIRTPISRLVYYAVMATLFLIPAFTLFDDTLVRCFFVVPVCFVLFYIFYVAGIVRGGADTKFLMVIGMMFQTYPAFSFLPLIALPPLNVQLVISFPIAVLFHAALFTLVYVFFVILRKVVRRKDPITMFNLTWYSMSIEEARRSHVWAKQDVVNGMVVNVRGIPDKGVYDRLESIGAKDVWVTPIIPFVIPMAFAFLFVAIVGNLLFIPFSL